jgi:hypothetical protein
VTRFGDPYKTARQKQPIPITSESTMARKKPAENEFIAFDVIYQDGAQTSNRRVASADIDPIDGDKSVKALIEAQDRKIEEMSGRPRGPIKSVKRSGR